MSPQFVAFAGRRRDKSLSCLGYGTVIVFGMWNVDHLYFMGHWSPPLWDFGCLRHGIYASMVAFATWELCYFS